MDDSRVRKASDILGMLLNPEAKAKADSWSGFFGFWGKAAGENLAAHSRPVDVRNGIVFVEADHPGWIQLLQMEQNRILSKIMRTFPELGISGIAFKLSKDKSLPGTVRNSVKTATEPASDYDDGDRARAEAEQRRPMPSVKQTIDSVADDSFKGILSSLADTLEAVEHDKTKPGR